MAARIQGKVTSTGQAKPAGQAQVRREMVTVYRIGEALYRLSVLSGGKNATTNVYFTHVK